MVVTYTGRALNAESYGGGNLGESVLVHISDSGKIAKSLPWRYENSGLASTRDTLEGSADYDGDGVDEALLSSFEWEFEANGSQSASVWRVVGRTIKQYPPARAFKIEHFTDVDNDGLPDLVTETVFRGIINGCGPDGTEVSFGPDWVVHARPDGSFAWDEVSRAAVLRSCPTEPTSVVPLTPGGVDNDELRRRLACAVIWGAAPERIIRELDSRCPAQKPAQDECAFEGTLPLASIGSNSRVGPPQRFLFSFQVVADPGVSACWSWRAPSWLVDCLRCTTPKQFRCIPRQQCEPSGALRDTSSCRSGYVLATN